LLPSPAALYDFINSLTLNEPFNVEPQNEPLNMILYCRMCPLYMFLLCYVVIRVHLRVFVRISCRILPATILLTKRLLDFRDNFVAECTLYDRPTVLQFLMCPVYMFLLCHVVIRVHLRVFVRISCRVLPTTILLTKRLLDFRDNFVAECTLYDPPTVLQSVISHL